MLAGEGMGRGKVEGQALVENAAVLVQEGAETRQAGVKNLANNGRDDLRNSHAGHPDDAYATAPRRGGDSGDGIRGGNIHEGARGP